MTKPKPPKSPNSSSPSEDKPKKFPSSSPSEDKPKKSKQTLPVPSYNKEPQTPIARLKDKYGVEKNVTLSRENVEANRELLEKYVQYFSAYPDIYLDLIAPAESHFHLYYYQRIFLRACMRFRYHYCIASRGFSKSFLSILAGFLRCIFLPSTNEFLVAPGASQGVEIAQEKINVILNTWPLLANEISKKNESAKEINIEFKNGSNFDVLTVTSKSRGLRRNAGIIDEVRDHDPSKLNSIILPVMNIARRTASGAYNTYEKHQPQTWISSASQKSSYNYQKLIDFMERSVIEPDEIFVQGSDYHVPVACGLMPQDYIRDIKNDSTFNEVDFAQEYLSIFTGGGSDSWIDATKLNRLRKIVNPQIRPTSNPSSFYIISVDVARSGEAKSVACIFEIIRSQTYWTKKLVNMYTIKGEERHFQDQANAIKKLIEIFNPREVVIDGTGLGRGLLDFMVMETYDQKTGKTYPAYGSFNDDELKKVQPVDAPRILNVYVLNATLASDIHSVCYGECASGHVQLLIEEKDAKQRLMATQKGINMKLDKRVERLLPYEMTTRLVEEMGNLRVKAGAQASKNIILERINKEIQKDRFSAFEYGIYAAKKIEDKEMKKVRKGKGRKITQFLFKN